MRNLSYVLLYLLTHLVGIFMAIFPFAASIIALWACYQVITRMTDLQSRVVILERRSAGNPSTNNDYVTIPIDEYLRLKTTSYNAEKTNMYERYLKWKSNHP